MKHRGPLYHLCKVSSDGSIVFYSNEDFLVFATIVFSYAQKYGIRITEFCIMLNHFHIAAYSESKSTIIHFYQTISSTFSRAYNNRTGKIRIKWKEGSNISEKYSVKNKKSLYIYIANNPPCKKCCNRAAEYKWSFLKQERPCTDKNPEESEAMELAKAIVRDSRKHGRHLSYNFFNHYFSILSVEDVKLLSEYVISTYASLDYSDIINLFGSFESFISAADATSGADYDIEEDIFTEDYRHYRRMTTIMRRLGLTGNDILLHDKDFDLAGLVCVLSSESCSSRDEVSRFLHLPRL